MNTWFVYILRCSDGSFYTGITTDVGKRLKRHQGGIGAAYTRSHLPVTLIWKESAVSESAARKREAEIKGWTRKEKERFLKRSRPDR